MTTGRVAIGALLALVLHAGDVKAEYPDQTIRLIVPFAPGGANDSVAGSVSDKLGTILGRPVVVENRPGGGTVIGTAAVAKANPDGYTLLLISPAHVINPYVNKSLPHQTFAGFTPTSPTPRSAYFHLPSRQGSSNPA